MQVVKGSTIGSFILIICGAICFCQAQSTKPPVPVAKSIEEPQPQPKKVQPPLSLKPIPVAIKEEPKIVFSETVATMPLAFIKNLIDTMPIGGKGYVSVSAIKCDSKLRCWLDPNQLFGTNTDERLILIFKDSQGYHISLEKINHQWVAQELPEGTKWIPVTTIKVK